MNDNVSRVASTEGAREHLGNALQVLADPDVSPSFPYRAANRRITKAIHQVERARELVKDIRLGKSKTPLLDTLARIDNLLS